MKINIIGGRGAMGRVHKKILEKAGHKVITSGRNTVPGYIEATKMADLTIISVPIHATLDIIKQVAPYAKAIMDFTSVKAEPINAMLEFSRDYTEVAGLHPLYGELKSVKGRTIVYCPTNKAGEKCSEVVKALEKAGAKIKTLSPFFHDKLINGVLQNVRASYLESFAAFLLESRLTYEELYEISPAPTRVLIDLAARLLGKDEKNQELYKSMRTLNPFNEKIALMSKQVTKDAFENKINYNKLKKFYGKDLSKAIKRSQKYVDVAHSF